MVKMEWRCAHKAKEAIFGKKLLDITMWNEAVIYPPTLHHDSFEENCPHSKNE